MTDQRTHIVVIGGGYAGTLAANHLRLRADVEITLVNPRPCFVERIRLHQLAARSGTAAVDYGTLLGEGIRLVVDSAERINSADRQIELASSFVLDYDYLIYAVGSTGAVPATEPGAVEFAYPIAELEHAERLRDALDELHPDAPVTVVGAGLTGIETASELAEQGRRGAPGCGGGGGPAAGRARTPFGGQVAAPPRRRRARGGRGPRGRPGRGRAGLALVGWRRAAKRADGVGRGARCG